MSGTPSGLDAATYAVLASTFSDGYPARCLACDTNGGVVHGDDDAGAAANIRALAISEALRFGEPVVLAGAKADFWLAVPVMVNAHLQGGFLANIAEDSIFPNGIAEPHVDMRAACADLLRCAEEANITNGALLSQRRDAHERERQRAEVIHQAKQHSSRSLTEIYLREEADLIAAIRRGDRATAHGIVNRTLTGIYHHGGTNLEVIKSLLLELTVMMSRGAVESGGSQADLLGTNLAALNELMACDSEQTIAHCLRKNLERIMNAIEKHAREPSAILLRDAVEYMEMNCCDEKIGRDEVAERAGLSPSRFSRMFKERIGRSFTDHLNHLRITRARQMLEHTDLSLLHIALDTGFSDPSYFTKVFRKHMGMTPKDFRKFNRKA
ncbi:MAG: AraC family transcriptional regulator [Planctomycetota bacterium]|jgi:AraC-like DNA-binding protein|nr:AraC family transcriptional regulator [Planctomycetota bacterium]